jgi:hypothetical protein
MFHSTHRLDRPSTAAIAVTALIAALAGPVPIAATPGPATDQATTVQTPVASPDTAPAKRALVGSWVETVTFPPEIGRPPLKSLGTFNADGTMICSDQGAVSIAPPPSAFTSCHGAWTHLKDRTFAYHALELISDLSGNLVGHLNVRGMYTVSPSGNAYTGTSYAEVVDVNGTVLFASPVTNAGQRITVP